MDRFDNQQLWTLPQNHVSSRHSYILVPKSTNPADKATRPLGHTSSHNTTADFQCVELQCNDQLVITPSWLSVAEATAQQPASHDTKLAFSI